MAADPDRAFRNLRRSGEQGMTLFELVACVTLMVSTLLVAIPQLARSLAAYDLSGATRRVYAELQHLRTAAVTTNTRQRFTIDQTGKAKFERFNSTTGLWEPSGIIAREINRVSVSTSGTIEFAPNGTAPSSGTVTVTNIDGKSRTVVVGAAGAVRIAAGS